MFKGLTTEVAQEVGKSGAILFNQLLQWFKSQNVEKVYRTNSELAEDLCGILSPATIQRAKVALVNAGYVEVSFDKGLNRTTHYTLTEKAKKLLEGVKQVGTSVKQKVSQAFSKPASPEAEKTKKAKAAHTTHTPNNKPLAAPPQHTPKAMQESFEKGFTNEDAVPCPQDLLGKLKGLLKGGKKNGAGAVEDSPEEKVYEDDSHLFPKKHSILDNPDDLSDEEYFNSIDAVVGLAYAGVPNVEIRNENLARINAMNNFKGEDW